MKVVHKISGPAPWGKQTATGTQTVETRQVRQLTERRTFVCGIAPRGAGIRDGKGDIQTLKG